VSVVDRCQLAFLFPEDGEDFLVNDEEVDSLGLEYFLQAGRGSSEELPQVGGTEDVLQHERVGHESIGWRLVSHH